MKSGAPFVFSNIFVLLKILYKCYYTIFRETRTLHNQNTLTIQKSQK